MSEMRRKKTRQQGDQAPNEAAGMAAQAANEDHLDTSLADAGLPVLASTPPARPPARRNRTGAAVASALTEMAGTTAPPQQTSAEPGTEAKEDVEAPRRKVKLVRSSFSLAKEDYATLEAFKEACRAQGVAAKKSQLLRAAVGLLRELEPARVAQLVAGLPAGRKT